MLKLVGFLLSIFLIQIILVQFPKEILGVTNQFEFVSSSSFQRVIKIVTVIGILIYFGIVLQLNINRIK